MVGLYKYLILYLLIAGQGLVPVFQASPESREQASPQSLSFCLPDAMPAVSVFHNPRTSKSSGPSQFLSFADLSGVLSLSISSESSGLAFATAGKPLRLHFFHTLLSLGCLLTV